MSDEGPNLPELVPPWIHDEDECLAETPIFSLRRRRGVSPTHPDTPGRFVYLDSRDWVNVIALTAERQVVLIEQFRHGTAEVTLEIPGGMVDPGEKPLAAGVRELREETGYEGSAAEVVGTVTPNPAILNNRCHTLLVRGAVQQGAPTPEVHEEIGVHLVPLHRIGGLIAAGRIHHALVVAAFELLALRERQ